MRLTNTAQRKGRNPMFSRISKRLTYANVAATLALVFAMSGGAYAASKYLITSTKQIKPSVLASLKGKNGAAGPAGAQGAPGPQGPAGPGGAQGAKGENGVAGKEGPQGKEGTVGKEGPAGKEGKEGKAGLTGFTETLPAGKMETGAWAATDYGLIEEELHIRVAIAFAIPLPAIGAAVFLNEEKTVQKVGTGGCLGTAEKPTAPPGTLCVYTSEEANHNVSGPTVITTEGEENKYSTAGAFLAYKTEKNSPGNVAQVRSIGTWAVTAPSAP
jgi:hypothetical protein